MAVILLFIYSVHQMHHPIEDIQKLIFLLSPLLAFVAIPEVLKSEMFQLYAHPPELSIFLQILKIYIYIIFGMRGNWEDDGLFADV